MAIDDIKSGFDRDIIIVPIGDGEGYEEWIGEAESSFDFPDFDENQTATLFYTTGTTGNPKGVSYSHRQLVLHTLGVAMGDQWSNIIQPVFTIPALAIAGLHVRQIMGYCFIAFIWTGLIFGTALLLY
jgi:acyl-CoA synthetase (AMP-forming)/AMP-acid ligase II